MQQNEQGAAGATAKAVASDTVNGPAEADFNIVPVGEIAGDRLVAFEVVLLECCQRRIGEYDAEAECVGRQIALVDGDLGIRPRLFHQYSKVEAGRAATEYRDPHRLSSCCLRANVLRYILGLKDIRCNGLVSCEVGEARWNWRDYMRS